MRSILYLVLILFVLSNCIKKETCPPDLVLGTLSLNANSRDYLPYNNIKSLEFVRLDSMIIKIDTIGIDTPFTFIYHYQIKIDTALLISPTGLINDTSKTVIENICKLEDERSDKFYFSEHKTANFFDTDTSRKFRIIGNLTIVEDYLSKSSTLADPVLYDELKLTVHRSNPSLSGAVATIEFVANDRGNDISRFSDSLKSKLIRFPLIPSVQINDSTFYNLYEVRNNDSIYYYFKPQVGVVAFRDINSKWWTLNRAH